MLKGKVINMSKYTPDSVVLECVKSDCFTGYDYIYVIDSMDINKEDYRYGFMEQKNDILGAIKGVKQFNDYWSLKDYPNLDTFELYEYIRKNFGDSRVCAYSLFLNRCKYDTFFAVKYNEKEEAFYGKRVFYRDGKQIDFSVIEDLPQRIDEVIRILEDIDAEEFKEKYIKTSREQYYALHGI